MERLVTVECEVCYQRTQISRYGWPLCAVHMNCARCGKKFQDGYPEGGLCWSCTPASNSTELITAYRAFHLQLDEAELVPRFLLRGAYGTNWESKSLHFECNVQANMSLYQCIAEDHGCGIYTVKTVEELVKEGSYNFGIIAQCTVYGEVVEFERGYRSSDVTIDQLIITEPHIPLFCDWLRAYYRVMVRCEKGHTEMPEGVALFGSWTHWLLNRELIKGHSGDVDAYIGEDFFWKYVGTYERNKKLVAYDRVGVGRGMLTSNKFLSQGTYKVDFMKVLKDVNHNAGTLGLTFPFQEVDAVVVKGELSLNTFRELLLPELDFRHNAIVYWKGELHELIPGAFEDVRLKRIHVLPTFGGNDNKRYQLHRDRYTVRRQQGWTFDWTQVPAVHMAAIKEAMWSGQELQLMGFGR